MVSINYGVSRVERKPHRRKQIVQQNGKIEVDIKLEDFDKSFKVIQVAILEKHPGWSLAGYCLSEKSHSDES